MPELLFPEKLYRIRPFVVTLFPQNIPTLPKAGRLKYFFQKLNKTNKRPHNFRDSARLKYSFYCTVRTVENPKSGNNAVRGNRFDRSRDNRNAEQGCNFSSKESGGSVSELIAFDREKRCGGGGGESPSNQSEKKLNKMLPYAHFKMEILFLLKEILLPGEFCARSI